jgi:hypothetical protein
MRPKIVIPVLLVILVVFGFVWLRSANSRLKTSTDEQLVSAPATPTQFQSVNKPPAVAVPISPAPPPAVVKSAGSQMEIHPITVETLQALAMNNDADSLKSILAPLTNSDPEIREAAKDAAVQFGDRAAAPALRLAAAQVESPEEKISLRDAADFLELPPLEVHTTTNSQPANQLPP